MFFNKKHIVFALFFVIFMCHTEHTIADGLFISGLELAGSYPGSDVCEKYTAVNTIGMNSFTLCWWSKSTVNSIKIFNKTVFSGSNSVNASGPLGQNYVPYTGTWKFMYYICPGLANDKTPEVCSIARSTINYQSKASVPINSTSTLNSQNADFTTGNGAIPAYSSMCYGLIEINNPEVTWRSNDARMCSDGHSLPTVPAACYLNYQSTLNVDLGTLERDKIATTARSGDKGNIIKSIQVLCTRDSGITVKTTFQYTSINVNGVGVVSTSNSALGVAIIYKGKVVTPSSSFTETFKSGYTPINLEFEAVSAFKSEDIPTGAFTANVVMVMTEQ